MSSDQIARSTTAAPAAAARRRKASSASGPVLLASSTGGHFTELEVIAGTRGIRNSERHWVVPESDQTTSRLSGHEAVSWVPKVHSRDLRGAMGNLRGAIALHRIVRPRLVVSAGAAQAVPHLLAAAMHGTPIAYTESVARLDGPSLTGRIAARLPRTELVAPMPGWGRRWATTADVFSGFSASWADVPAPVTSAVVALGSERFAFPRAIKLVRAAISEDVDITWQVGSTHPSDGVSLNRWLKAEDLALAMCVSSIVITHGGAGSILTALASGKVPIVLPRTAAYGEHVDDHQVQMCEMLHERGLVVMVEPGQRITPADVRRAATSVVTPVGIDVSENAG